MANSKTKSPRKKKHNPHKAGEQMIRHLFRNVGVVFVPAMVKGCQLVSLGTGKLFIPSLRQALCVEKTRFCWSVHCAVFCRDQNGKEYTSIQTYPVLEPVYQHQLIDFMNTKHQELIDSCNRAHIINVGWLSTMRDVEVKDSMMDKIFASVGAWDGLAQWEAAKLQEKLSSTTESD